MNRKIPKGQAANEVCPLLFSDRNWNSVSVISPTPRLYESVRC
ncbi:Uncharacterized protein dnm_047580 [Desulfonema magnum]|uniref:Uncharacterized protein n=1 Tax=Desulfonema magnum TaxID=45655 RepID=A0A975BND8_9BACT|nr:Uncharacterized protein dnm_047580 [Desulfonema magnum]